MSPVARKRRSGGFQPPMKAGGGWKPPISGDGGWKPPLQFKQTPENAMNMHSPVKMAGNAIAGSWFPSSATM